LQENKIPIFEREGWLCQPSLSKIGILLIRRSLSNNKPILGKAGVVTLHLLSQKWVCCCSIPSPRF